MAKIGKNQEVVWEKTKKSVVILHFEGATSGARLTLPAITMRKGTMVNRLTNRLSRREFVRGALLVPSIILPASTLLTAGRAYADDDEPIVSGQVVFDLSNPNTQTQTVVLPDGTESVFGYEPVSEGNARDSAALSNGSGTFKAYWYSGVLNMSHNIRISNYVVTSVYNAFAGGSGVVSGLFSVTSNYLNHGTSWTQHTAAWQDNAVGTVTTKTILGNIEGNYLVYSYILS